MVAYLGAFNVVFRKSIIGDWISACNQHRIKCSEDFSLMSTQGDPVRIRQWQIAGLPKDQESVQEKRRKPDPLYLWGKDFLKREVLLFVLIVVSF